MTESVVGAMRDAGHWNPMWDGVAELDPEWTESFMRTTMSTYRGGVLTPQVVELLCIAVDAACTHLYAPGVRRHMRAALDLGVEPREILEVLKLATTVGVHSINVGADPHGGAGGTGARLQRPRSGPGGRIGRSRRCGTAAAARVGGSV